MNPERSEVAESKKARKKKKDEDMENEHRCFNVEHENNILLNHNPKYKINIPESILTWHK